MKKISIAFSLLLISLLMVAGCSSSKSGGRTGENSLLDVLTDFSVSINENNFNKALGLVVDEERAEILGPGGVITKDVKLKLKALRLQNLIKNTRIKLFNGKLMGIAATLPNVDHYQGSGSPDLVSDTTLINEGAAPETSEPKNTEVEAEPDISTEDYNAPEENQEEPLQDDESDESEME